VLSSMSKKVMSKAVEARIRIGWQLVPLLTNEGVSLIMRGRLYSSCVRSGKVIHLQRLLEPGN